MAKRKPIERARDELFSHIHRCGVLEAHQDDQDSWMTETIDYLAERYPDLGTDDLTQLRAVGIQFCKPVISRLQRDDPPEEEPAAGEENDKENGEAVLGDSIEA